MLVIGLDAASQFSNFGYATGNWTPDSLGVTAAGVFGKDATESLSWLASLLRNQDRALIAIDAPLGWPEPMGRFLNKHMAGQRLPVSKNEFFRRKTDAYVKEVVGKNPLEIGADRIARASHHGLEVLAKLREMSGKSIPLAWGSDFVGVAVIEVYPAATLVAHQVVSSGYKTAEGGLKVRTGLAKDLRGRVKGIHGSGAVASEHAFDACLCLLAAKDFLIGEAAQPEDRAAAEREGWIWVRRCVQKGGDINNSSSRRRSHARPN